MNDLMILRTKPEKIIIEDTTLRHASLREIKNQIEAMQLFLETIGKEKYHIKSYILRRELLSLDYAFYLEYD